MGMSNDLVVKAQNLIKHKLISFHYQRALHDRKAWGWQNFYNQII